MILHHVEQRTIHLPEKCRTEQKWSRWLGWKLVSNNTWKVLWCISQSAMKLNEGHRQSKTQTNQDTKAVITTETPSSHIQLSRKTKQAGSAAQDNFILTRWDHFANFPGSVVLLVGYLERCCSSCRLGFSPFCRPQAEVVGGQWPSAQPFTGVSHPVLHRSLWAGVSAMASWSPPWSELEHHVGFGEPAAGGTTLEGRKMGSAGAVSALKYPCGMNCCI